MNRKLRLGFIGAGWWATVNHMPLLGSRPDVELVGACGLDPAVLDLVKTKFGFGFVTSDYKELLDRNLDGVIVSTPHHRHFEHARAALTAGCHVLCEKPMTLRAAEAWELVNLAKRQRREILVPYGWHYQAFIQTAKSWLEEGLVGEIEYVLCHMASPTIELFAGRGVGPATWSPTVVKPDPATWQAKSNGGGYAHGQITHSSALLFWLTNLRAQEVTCLMSGPHAPVDLYDAATVRFTNGAIGTVSGAATLPDDDKFQIDLRVFGSDGALLLDVERERLEVRRRDGRHRTEKVAPGAGAYSCEVPPHRFVEVMQGRGRNDSSAEIAARSVELIEAMHLSAQSGRRVLVAEL